MTVADGAVDEQCVDPSNNLISRVAFVLLGTRRTMSRWNDPARLQKEIDAQKKRAEGEPQHNYRHGREMMFALFLVQERDVASRGSASGRYSCEGLDLSPPT